MCVHVRVLFVCVGLWPFGCELTERVLLRALLGAVQRELLEAKVWTDGVFLFLLFINLCADEYTHVLMTPSVDEHTRVHADFSHMCGHGAICA